MRTRTANLNVKLADGQNPVIEIYDDIGPAWLGMIDTKSVAAALKEAGDAKEIDVRINSKGGDAYEGIGIHNVLKQHAAKINIRVDGVAASSASLIAMAGDSIQMPKNALMMIHEPWGIAVGHQEDLRKTADWLGKINAAAMESYIEKSGQPKQKIAQWLSDETWFTADEAIEAGLADEVLAATTPKQLTTREPFQFKNPPSQLADLLVGRPGDPSMSDPKPETAPKPAADPKAQDTPPADPKPANDPPKDVPASQMTAEEVQRIAGEAAQKAQRDEQKRQSDIRALCRQAGHAELADTFCNDPDKTYTVEDVRAQLFDKLCKANPSPDDDGGDANDDDPDAKFKAEYKQNKAQLSCTEEEYVAMRRVDEGLDDLVVGSAAAE